MKKNKIPCLLFLIVFLAACEEADVTNNQIKNKITEVQMDSMLVDSSIIVLPADSLLVADLTKVQFFMPEEIAVLKQFTSDSIVFFMDYHLVNYFEAKQDTLLIKNFNNLVQIFQLFTANVIDSPQSQKSVDGFLYPDNMKATLSFLQDATPFVIHTCVAECTEYGIDFDLFNITKQAATTKGKLDDEYFEILTIAQDNYFSLSYSFKTWFMQMWDYGGGSLLGNKTTYNFLKKVKQFESKWVHTDAILEVLKADAYNTAMHGVYMKGAVAILEEIKILVNENLVTSEQAANLNQLSNLIKSNATVCPVCTFKELQVNCDTENCNFGG